MIDKKLVETHKIACRLMMNKLSKPAYKPYQKDRRFQKVLYDECLAVAEKQYDSGVMG